MKTNRNLMLIVFFILLSSSLSWADEDSRFTYDIGLSAGNSSGESYTEANLGLNYYVKEWFIWRNSFFARFPSGELEDVYGLDTSARFNWINQFSETSRLTLFGGPGYRFQTEGESRAFAEAGFKLNTSGLNFGIGVKSFLKDIGDENSSSDTQYFIVLSGSGEL